MSSWGCRLEDLLDRAIEVGECNIPDIDRALKSKFWRGLLPHLKVAYRHKAEEKVEFDRFRVVVRKIESEGYKVKTTNLKISKMTLSVPRDNVKELMELFKLATQVSYVNEQLGMLQSDSTVTKIAHFQGLQVRTNQEIRIRNLIVGIAVI